MNVDGWMDGWMGGWVVTMCNVFVCSKVQVNQRDEDFLKVNQYE